MSDPVTNIEIEDVLSSIRRLVSETDRSPERPASAPERPASAPDRGASAPDRGVTGAERLVLSPALRVADPVLRLPQQDDPVLRLPQQDHPVLRLPPQDDTPPPAARAAVIEAALAGAAEEWEPDGSEAQPVMDWSAPAPDDPPVQPARPDTPTPLLTAIDTDPPEAPVDAAPDGDMDETLGAALADRIATLGAARGLDEATLRALVVEVVRDELQGALGERITRNVRKLVRREIFRVLSSQEFD